MKEYTLKSCQRNAKDNKWVEKYDNFTKMLHAHIKDNKVYCYIFEQDEQERANKIINVSLTNDFFIKQDKGYLFDDDYEYKDGYHPYFFEFSAQLGSKDSKKAIGVWEGLPRSKWIEAELVVGDLHDEPLELDEQGNMLHLRGILIFSASPIIRKGVELVFKLEEAGAIANEIEEHIRDLDNFLENYCLQYNRYDIKNQFKRFVQNINSLKCNVYNVGQGNNISLDINGKRMFFDVGTDAKRSIDTLFNFKYENNKGDITEVIPYFIVLSHWDLDHILGVADFDWKLCGDKSYSIYTSTYWIAPNLRLLSSKKIAKSAFRLCCYLLKNERLWLVCEPGQLVLKSEDCELWQGKGSNNNNSKKNNIGLVMKLSIPDHVVNNQIRQNILFMGDCDFNEFPELKNDRYDILVTAHHGSKYAIPNGVIGNKGSRAIISVGADNSYNHPNIEHLAMLQNNNFRAYFTCGTKKIVVFVGEDNTVHLQSVKDI